MLLPNKLSIQIYVFDTFVVSLILHHTKLEKSQKTSGLDDFKPIFDTNDYLLMILLLTIFFT